MIIVFSQTATVEEKSRVKNILEDQGFSIHTSDGLNTSLIGVVGETSRLDMNLIREYDGVEKVLRVQEPYKLANRAFHPEDSVLDVSGVPIGGKKIQVIAGPCSVETQEQVTTIAQAVKAGGASMMRGGAFKPRTSPYSFQGLKELGLEYLKNAREATGLPIVTEIMSADKIERFVEDVDLIQVGARNMQNFELLKELGKTNVPILLKRGLSATIEEWIMSAEYIMAGGNENVILCERGIRTFEHYTRNTLDLSAVLAAKKLTHLPVIVDPSHAAGMWWMVEPLAKAAVAVGADGLLIEVHNNPECAWCDGAQSLKPAKFANLMQELKIIARVIGREA
ncbi:MAG: 3-deoxy-7-phosphoheptulonate synthase [Phascolarctobacterium sp.]|nr:3-deoxy-7-phosphoheptulonate synthase [Phascolarctobacterium sp.]